MSGQASAGAGTSSPSIVRSLVTVFRSIHTDPSRTARTASARARRTRSSSSANMCQVQSGVDVRYADHPVLAELTQEAAGVDCYFEPDHDLPPASSSETWDTSSAPGRQENTPTGEPSTTGVSGPAIPLTNR